MLVNQPEHKLASESLPLQAFRNLRLAHQNQETGLQPMGIFHYYLSSGFWAFADPIWYLFF